MSCNIIKQQWKYFRIELFYFIGWYILFPILTDVEFNYREKHHTALFLKDIESRVVYGFFNMIAFVIFYKLVQQFLFKRRVMLFLLSIIVFMAFYHFYHKGVDLFIARTPIFSRKLQNDALQSFNRGGGLSFGISFLMMELLCVIALAYFVRSARQDEQMQQLKEQQLLSELNYLKSQLHPHFFFNTLNNIYSLALKQSAETAPVVAKLAEMMRYILYEADQQEVLLSREIEFLSNYVTVEKIRHHNGIDILLDVQGDYGQTYIQPLLLLPFVENAFKHGLQEETRQGFVRIVICRDEKELSMQVANSKPVHETGSTKGVGLQNVHKRLDILYPDGYKLEIKNEKTRYQVNLTLQTHD